MKKLLIILSIIIMSVTCMASSCYYMGEETSGFLKICYYSCDGGTTRTINIAITDLCPMAID